MKLSKRRKRTAKKLAIPFIALAMMATMFFMESASRRSHNSSDVASRTTVPAAR